eukprot:jgi/Mesen1/45/ME1097609C05707
MQHGSIYGEVTFGCPIVSSSADARRHPKYDKHRRFDSLVDVQDDAIVLPSVPLPEDKQAAER